MRASTKRMLSFLIAFLLLLGAIMVYAILITPSYEEIQRKRGAIVSGTAVFEEQKRVIGRIRELLDRYTGNSSLQDTLSLSLPDEPFISQIVGNAYGLAAVNKMFLTSAESDILPFVAAQAGQTTIKNLGTVKLNIGLEGNYADFKKFLSQIETNVRIMDIKEINVNTASGDKGSIDKGNIEPSYYSYDLSLDAYYQDKSAQAKSTQGVVN